MTECPTIRTLAAPELTVVIASVNGWSVLGPTLEDVATIAPEAGYLLTAAFPKLSLAQADRILTATEGPGGGFILRHPDAALVEFC